MIIIPAEQTLDWRRPPYATLLLIVINVLVFFIYQLDDESRYDEAFNFYLESPLLEREAPLFLAFVEENRDFNEVRQIQDLVERYSEAALTGDVIRSLDFSAYIEQRVREGSLEPFYLDEDRLRFQELQNSISYYAYGLVPGRVTISGFFGHMFLHGGIDHLLGNMVFLFLCGFALEVAFGYRWFLGLYFLSGIISALFSIVTDWGGFIPGIGASGAISGLMGMYAALYATRQIRFFYWILFFFGYFTAPALLIFPIWVLLELYGAMFVDNNIGYFAHLGGLLGGFGLVTVLKDKLIQVDEAYVEKVLTEEELLEKETFDMWNLAGQMKFDRAWDLGQSLLKKQPNNQVVLSQCYKVAKVNPASKRYHQISRDIFLKPSEDGPFTHFQLDTLQDYLNSTTDPLSLNLKICHKLIKPSCLNGYSSEAFKLAEVIMQLENAKPETRTPETAKALFRVLMKLLEEKKTDKARSLFEYLKAHFSNEEETELALQAMERVANSSS